MTNHNTTSLIGDIFFKFSYRASACRTWRARYCITISVRLSVRPTNASILSKRRHILSQFLTFLTEHEVTNTITYSAVRTVHDLSSLDARQLNRCLKRKDSILYWMACLQKRWCVKMRCFRTPEKLRCKESKRRVTRNALDALVISKQVIL